MKTILQVSPTEEVTYSMPADLFELVSAGLRYRLFRTVSAAVAALPPDLQAQVTQTARLVGKPKVKGLSHDILMLDDFAFPDDEPVRFVNQTMATFWNEVPKDKVSTDFSK